MINNSEREQVIVFNEHRDVMNLSELCELLEIGRNKAYQLLNFEQIKAFKCGRAWKIPKEAVEQYIRLQSGL